MGKKTSHNCIRVALFWFKLAKSPKGNLVHEFERFTSKKEAWEIMRKRNVKLNKSHFDECLRKEGCMTFTDTEAGIGGVFRLDTGKSFRDLFHQEIKHFKPEGEHHHVQEKGDEKIVLQKTNPEPVPPPKPREYPKEYALIPYLVLGETIPSDIRIRTDVLLLILKHNPDSDFKDLTQETLYEKIEDRKYLWLRGCFITTVERRNAMFEFCRKKELFVTYLGHSVLCRALLTQAYSGGDNKRIRLEMNT